MRKTVLYLGLAVTLCVSLFAGGFPVYDFINDFNRTLQHEMEMVKLALQIDQLQSYRQEFAAFQSYRAYIDGQFRELRDRLQGNQTRVVQSGNADAGLPAWGASPFSGTAAASALEQNIESVRSVMNGANPGQFQYLGDSVRALYGDSPQTLIGARTKIAEQEIAAHIAWVNRINTAVDEKRNNIDYLRNRINSGQLTPGDLQREMTILATEQADLQTLEIQAQNAATRVSLQQLSLQTGNANTQEAERVQDSLDRLNLMQSATSFSFGTPSGPTS